MLLSIQNISKQFNHEPALTQISLDIDQGEIVCLLGPSGCGKTTLLRIIAGLETADSGQVLLDGQDLGPTPSHRRDFGLMFQDFALFPHKSVFENVAFGLRMQRGGGAERWRRRGAGEQGGGGAGERGSGGAGEIGELENNIANRKPALPVLSVAEGSKVEGSQIANRVQEMLVLVGLEGFEQRRVTDLSGGEAQRVALARSLAPSPRLLMLDEPLGSLDRTLRERLMNDLRDILKQVGVTALYVTHDQAEAFAIADRVVVMNKGRIEQIGPPEEIYRRPATSFVAQFLGLTNLAEGQVLEPGRVNSPWGELTVETGDHPPGATVTILIRPEAVRSLRRATEETPLTTAPNLLRGRLTRRSFRGGRYRLRLQPQRGSELTFELTAAGDISLSPGDLVLVELDLAGVVMFI